MAFHPQVYDQSLLTTKSKETCKELDSGIKQETRFRNEIKFIKARLLANILNHSYQDLK